MRRSILGFSSLSGVLAAIALLVAAPAQSGLRLGDDRLLVDAERGLTWVADGRYVVHSGLAEHAVLPRAEALEVIARLNAGWVENFGHGDWRLPTERELRHLLGAEGDRLAALTGDDPVLLAAGFAADRAAGAAAAGDPVVVWPVRGSLVEAGFSEVAVFAANSVRLKNQAAVVSGDVVVNDASPGPTLVAGYEAGMDPRSSTPAGWSVRADSVRIKNNATVGGDVAYNELFNQGKVEGALISPLALPVFSLLPAFHAQPPVPGSPDVEVPGNGFASLPAGDYGSLTIGKDGTLLLSGGVYNVRSIATGKGARLVFGAPSQVRVEERVLTGRDAVIGPDAGSGVPVDELVFYVAGVNGKGGGLLEAPLAAELGHGNLVGASFYAPNGTLRIGHGSDVTGAFLARDVLVENQATVTLDSYFFNRAPVAGDDAATVDEGGTVSVLDSGASSVLANDTDPDLDLLTVTTTPVVAPAHGTLILAADGTFGYSHDGSETTADSFVYEVCDQGFPVLCDTATVSITVVPVNDPPVAADDSATVDQGGTTSVLDSGALSVLDNDFDAEGGLLTVTATPVVPPAHGTLVLGADGTFSYTHDGSEFVTDSFVYEVCDDGSPVECDTATVSITVLGPAALSVVRFGLGDGRVTSSPAGIDCGAACSAEFPAATPVTLIAEAFAGSAFGGFSGDPDCADGVVTMDASKTCLARFDLDAPPAVLTVTLAGAGSGTVTSDPAGIGCPGTCSAGFPIPTRVTLTATAAPGSSFAGWSGDPACADGVVDLLGDVSCVALFEPGQAEITVIRTGLGSGTVTSDPAGIDCGLICTAEFDAASPVTLAAEPDEGSVFGGFSGDPDCADGVITPDAGKTCFARFDLDVAPAVLTVALAGDGSGRVASDPAGIDCPGTCSAGYPIPTRVTLEAAADPGSSFTGWSGDADCIDGEVDMVADASCTATFELDAPPPASFTLTVLFLGGGTGVVGSNPPGIGCGGDCSADFAAGTSVTLQARPDGEFGGWGGDCEGAEFLTAVLLDADKTCTVTFE